MNVIFLKKVWSWIKNHWYLPLIFVVVALFFLLRRSPNQHLLYLIQKQRENYKKEIEIIKDASEQEKKKKQNIKEKHKNTIKNIEKEYNVELENLEEKKKEEISEMIKKHEEDPEALAKEVAKILSSEYLKTEWEKKN